MSFPLTEPAAIFAVLLGVALIVPLISARIRIPAIVGLILAGVIIGPKGLGFLERNEMIDIVGRAGLLYIMLLAGLEIDLVRFKRYRGHSIAFGSISFSIPQVIGTFVALLLLDFTVTQAVLLSSMFASHTLLTYPIASRLGISKNNAVTAAVGGTIVTDTSALLVLAVIAAMVRGEMGLDFWVQLVISLGVFLFLTFWLLPRVGRWFFRTISAEGARDFLFVIFVAYLFAYLSQVAGVEAIIGAFLCGLALNPLIPSQSPVMSRVNFLGTVLLIPLFLVSVGMLVDIGALISDPSAIKVAVVMCCTVISMKFLAAWIAGAALNYSQDERFVMFGLTVNQAAATLAAVLVGLEIGVFDTRVLNGTILMILVTCLIGPIVVERFGRRVAEAEEREPLRAGDAPQRILIPLANPASAEALVDISLMIRQKGSKEPLFPLAVVSEGENVEGRVLEIEKVLSVAVVRGASGDAPVVPLTRVDANIAEGIRRALVEQRISTVVIGWNGQVSFASRVFGSVLDQLLSQSRQLILVARTVQPMNTHSRLVVVVPRRARRELTFPETLRTIKVLASQLSATLLVLTHNEDKVRLGKIVEEAKPEVPLEMASFPSLSRVPNVLKKVVTEDDLVVLVSARDHRYSWAPELDQLPRQIALQFRNTSFITLYPSEFSEESVSFPESAPAVESGSQPTQTSRAFVSPERLRPHSEEKEAVEAIHELVQVGLSEDPDIARRLGEALQRSARDFPAKLRDGVVLVHAHVEGLEIPMLFLATRKGGFDLPGDDEQPAELLFALASPQGISPARHLTHLSAIAKCVRSDETVAELLEAKDTEALSEILSRTVVVD